MTYLRVGWRNDNEISRQLIKRTEWPSPFIWLINKNEFHKVSKFLLLFGSWVCGSVYGCEWQKWIGASSGALPRIVLSRNVRSSRGKVFERFIWLTHAAKRLGGIWQLCELQLMDMNLGPVGQSNCASPPVQSCLPYASRIEFCCLTSQDSNYY